MFQQDASHYRQEVNHLFKVLVLGDPSTGKTSFIKRYVNELFSRAYKATIGLDFAIKTIMYDQNTTVRLQLWDIAGQERFGSMTRIYYKNAVGALLVFDVNAPKTFESVMKWKADLDAKVAFPGGTPLPCLLLANKCDLVDRSEEDEQLLKKFAHENGFVGCLYTSPKFNVNVDQAIKLLVREIMQRMRKSERDELYNHDTIVMTDQFNERSRSMRNGKRGCC